MTFVVTLALYYLAFIFPRTIGVNSWGIIDTILHTIPQIVEFDEEAIAFSGIPCFVYFSILAIYTKPRLHKILLAIAYFAFMILVGFGRDILPAQQEWIMIAPSCVAMWISAFLISRKIKNPPIKPDE